MHPWTGLATGLGGLVVGPLVAAVVARLAVGEPASAHPSPVSPPLIRASGRDRVLVSLLAALVLAALGLRLGPNAALPAYLYLGAVCVALAVIDARTSRLPDPLTLPSYAVGIAALAPAAAVTDGGLARLGLALAGMAALYLLYAALFLVNPAGLGWGDVKLAGVLGLHLGWLGVRAWITGAFLGFLLGALFGIGLLAARRATRKTTIPFGPFMIAGALVAILVEGQLAMAYTGD